MFNIKWTMDSKHIESVLREYINSYVLCQNCLCLNTMINKNNSTRLLELKCNKCSSHRSCKRIEKAFKTIANKQQRIQQKQQQAQIQQNRTKIK